MSDQAPFTTEIVDSVLQYHAKNRIVHYLKLYKDCLLSDEVPSLERPTDSACIVLASVRSICFCVLSTALV